MNVKNINFYNFQKHAIIQCHGYLCYPTLPKTGHEIQDGRHLKKWHKSSKFRAYNSLLFQISLLEFDIYLIFHTWAQSKAAARHRHHSLGKTLSPVVKKCIIFPRQQYSRTENMNFQCDNNNYVHYWTALFHFKKEKQWNKMSLLLIFLRNKKDFCSMI